MFRISRLLHRDEQGESLVEMALAMLLLLLLLVGVADFGRAFNNYIIITNASREGARYASHFPFHEDGIVQAAIDEALDSGVTLEGSDITIDGLGAGAGEPIRVTVTYGFPTIMGSLVGATSLTLRSSTEMVIFGLDI